MKILALPDLHLTDKTPENRLDNYPETQEAKMNQIFEIDYSEKINVMCQPGDLFDSDKANDYLKQKWLPIFRDKASVLLTVFGQHDLRYHSRDKRNTPLQVLRSAESITLLNKDPHHFNNCDFYGCSWGEEVPEIQNPDIPSILLIHKMFVMDKKLWQGQKEFALANNFMKQHNFKVVISGDNHNHFFWSDGKGRFHINCGSLMRNRIDQIHHKPCVYVIDLEKNTAEQVLLNIRPFEEVMNLEEAEKEDKKNEKLQAFIKKLPDESKIEGLKFEENLANEVAELKEQNVIDEGVEEMLNEIMEACV